MFHRHVRRMLMLLPVHNGGLQLLSRGPPLTSLHLRVQHKVSPKKTDTGLEHMRFHSAHDPGNRNRSC